jgi:quercetin dioxygenase-like cupin family protein
MAKKNQTIHNPVTGEKITWLETSADTGGRYLLFDFEIKQGGKVAVRHIHPLQDETFTIQKGQLKLEMNGHTKIYHAGDMVTVPKGTPHEWWNSGDGALQMQIRFAPALKTEIFFEQFFGLAHDGKTDHNGSPTFMQIMAMCNEYSIYVAGPPLFVQRLMGTTIGGIARLTGRKKFYPQYSPVNDD